MPMNTNDHARLQTKRTIASAGKRKCTRASGDETTRRRARRGAGNESDAYRYVHHHLFLLHHLPLSAQIRPRQPAHRERAHHSRHVTPPPSHRLAQPQNQPNGRLAASARVEEGEGLRETGEERGWVGCRVSQNSPPPSPRKMHGARQLTCASLLRGYRAGQGVRSGPRGVYNDSQTRNRAPSGSVSYNSICI